jgi:hypothetical protein
MADNNSGPFTFGSIENSWGANGINGMLDPGGIFQPPPNPANGAFPYFNQAISQLPGYFQPYINAGNWALPQLQNQYSQLTNNPGAVMNKMGADFKQSPGYQFQTQQALDAANRAASAGGMLGTPMEQQNVAGVTNQLANQDYYNYLNHAMSMYGMGLNGMNDMAHMGYGASSNLGEDMTNALMGEGQLAYAGQANVNQGRFGMLGNVMGAAGGLLAFL